MHDLISKLITLRVLDKDEDFTIRVEQTLQIKNMKQPLIVSGAVTHPRAVAIIALLYDRVTYGNGKRAKRYDT